VKLQVARHHFTVVKMRASLPRRAWAFSLGLALLGGCATAPPASPDRYSPAEMKHGPSLYETGRIAVVPPSSDGLRIEEGAIDRASPAAHASSARPATAESARGKHRIRARASQAR
jgi:hypothetical protein